MEVVSTSSSVCRRWRLVAVGERGRKEVAEVGRDLRAEEEAATGGGRREEVGWSWEIMADMAVVRSMNVWRLDMVEIERPNGRLAGRREGDRGVVGERGEVEVTEKELLRGGSREAEDMVGS